MLCILLVAIANIGDCFAQTVVAPQPIPGIPLKRTDERIGKAEIYRFETMSRFDSVFLNRSKKDIMRVTFDVPNSEPAKPKMVHMFYYSYSSKGLIYTTNHKMEISFKGSGKEGKFEHEAKITIYGCSKENKNDCYEYLAAAFPYEFIESMAKAESVSIKFGDVIFELTKDEIRGIQDLIQITEKDLHKN